MGAKSHEMARIRIGRIFLWAPIESKSTRGPKGPSGKRNQKRLEYQRKSEREREKKINKGKKRLRRHIISQSRFERDEKERAHFEPNLFDSYHTNVKAYCTRSPRSGLAASTVGFVLVLPSPATSFWVRRNISRGWSGSPAE